MVIAACDCVGRPEAAVVDPVWRKRGGVGGLRLVDLIREPWERLQRETAERAAAAEEAERELEEFLSSERLRDRLQDLNRNWYGVTSHDEQLRHLAENDATALHLLLNSTDPMTPLERRAWGFFARRTEMSRFLGRPVQVREQFPMSSEEREAVTSLREDWFARQKEFLAFLHARYPYLPWVLRAIRTLDAGTLLHQETWRNRHDRTKNDLVELKRLQGRSLDYAGWRSLEVSNCQWGAGPIARHASRSTRRLARAVDEERLRACPQCEQLVVPSRSDLRYQVGYCCFCGGRDQLLTITKAEEAGLVEPDGEGFWRVRHGPVPGWATSQPLPPLDEDAEIDLEEPE
jgi:hypothetical protein